jgi:hypothetical protein
MALIATNKGGNFALAPAGVHIARCYGIYDLGTQPDMWLGKPKPQHKIRIAFELPNEKHVFDEKKGEEPFTLSTKYTASTGDRSNFRKTLEAWRGRPFTEEEIKAFDISKLLGVTCLLNVIHKTGKENKVRANVASISKLVSGQTCPPAINPPRIYQIEEKTGGCFKELPEWIQTEISQSIEFRGIQATTGGADAGQEGAEDETDPF